MEPTLPNGAAIKVDLFESDAHRVGQIVVCATAGKLIAHRVVYTCSSGRTRHLVVTQGDGCLVCDPPLRGDTIQGRVTSVCIDGRWQVPVATWTRGPWRRAIAAASIRLTKACLWVDFRFARYVTGTLFALAGQIERMRR